MPHKWESIKNCGLFHDESTFMYNEDQTIFAVGSEEKEDAETKK